MKCNPLHTSWIFSLFFLLISWTLVTFRPVLAPVLAACRAGKREEGAKNEANPKVIRVIFLAFSYRHAWWLPATPSNLTFCSNRTLVTRSAASEPVTRLSGSVGEVATVVETAPKLLSFFSADRTT